LLNVAVLTTIYHPIFCNYPIFFVFTDWIEQKGSVWLIWQWALYQ